MEKTKIKLLFAVVLLFSFANLLLPRLYRIQYNSAKTMHEEPIVLHPLLAEQAQEHGIILTSFFSFAPDPRITQTRKPDFATLYHFWMTVVHYRLRAIIFYDQHAFDQDFVDKYTRAPYLTFVKVETPTLAKGKKGDTNPNDFRFGVFGQYLKEHPNKYKWYLIADRDMLFNRDPFVKLDHYQQKYNQEFFGSFDGLRGWKRGAQGHQFPKCYGEDLTSTFRNDVEWKTPNGNCGLWAGTYPLVQCVLDCMANEFNTPPVVYKGGELPCDMAVHDYCVFYGGCFPNTTKGEYAETLPEVVRWGPATMGERSDLFGPPIRGNADAFCAACIKDSWTAVHYRCGNLKIPPLCFNHTTFGTDGPLVKYQQNGHAGGFYGAKQCHLDSQTDLPLPNK